MSSNTRRKLAFYLAGYGDVFLHVLCVSVLAMWAIQAIGMLYGFTADWSAVLGQLVLLLSFAVYFPGQTFWTYRKTASDGAEYVIVGAR